MELCFVNIDKLKDFKFNSIEEKTETLTFNVGGYQYKFTFEIVEIKLNLDDLNSMRFKPKK